MENQEFCAAPIIPGIPVPGIPIGMPVPEVTQEDVETYLWMHHPMGRQLLDLEITPDKEVPHGEFLFRLQGKPCFRKGELVAITGKAKSGKTFFCSALMAAAGGGYSLGIRRISATPLRVLWIDTEQSEDSTQEILCQRIMKMLGSEAEHKPRAINLRSVSWEDRMDLIESAIELAKPDLVLLDGIRDTIADINDGPGSQCVIDRCLRLASRSEACIVCVLHQNKAAEDKTLRGALGTELMNKCFETYECKKSEDRVLSVEQVLTRKYDIRERLYFTIADDGLPQLLTPGQSTTAEGNTGTLNHSKTLENIAESTVPRLQSPELLRRNYEAILEPGMTMSNVDLGEAYMQRYGIYSKTFYYRTIMPAAVDCGVLIKNVTPQGWFFTLGEGPAAAVNDPPLPPEENELPF